MGGCRHREVSWGLLKAVSSPGPTPLGAPHPPITFCSASRSGLPCVNAKMGSLATFREETCFQHSLGSEGGEQRWTGKQRPPPAPALLSPTGGPRLAQHLEIQGNYRTGGREPALGSKTQVQDQILPLWVLGHVTCLLRAYFSTYQVRIIIETHMVA